jgi:catechol 2,3-dioxygenase-like lactoylglutathione lyase family enzyme
LLRSALDERAVPTRGLRVEDGSWRPDSPEWQALRLKVVESDRDRHVPLVSKTRPHGSGYGPSRHMQEGRSVLPDFRGWGHIELTVRDAEASAAWYQRVLGFVPRGDHRSGKARTIVLEHRSGVVLGFWQHDEEPTTDVFDEYRTGLDHLSFQVSTRGEIDEWATHFESLGVRHSPPVDVGPHGVVLTFRDPDNIQLEIYWRPA